MTDDKTINMFPFIIIMFILYFIRVCKYYIELPINELIIELKFLEIMSFLCLQLPL